MNNPAFTAFTALALKVVGAIMILSSLVNYIVLAIPPQGLSADGLPGWLVNLTSQLSDRGIIPMIGIVFIASGFWIAETIGAGSSDRVSALDLRFLSFGLAVLLGLMFLLAIPLHLFNLQRTGSETIQEIARSVNVAEARIEAQSEQLNALLDDPERLNELDRALEEGSVSGEQRAQLEAVREQVRLIEADPSLLDSQIEQARTQLRERRKQAEGRAWGTATKTAIRTTISCSLLAAGYFLIGGLGLRSLSGSGGRRRTVIAK